MNEDYTCWDESEFVQKAFFLGRVSAEVQRCPPPSEISDIYAEYRRFTGIARINSLLGSVEHGILSWS
jgi:hypothetical protein